MYSRLLLTNDGSDLAAAAVPWAAVVARDLDADVVVLRVSRAAGAPVDDLSADTWTHEIARGGRDEPGAPPEEAHPPLSETVDVLRAAGLARVGSLVVQGEPGEAIVGAALGLGCDLVVMASHGLSGMHRAVLGSVADHVIRHSGVPVLLCRPLPDGTTPALGSILVALDGSPLADGLLSHAQAIAAASAARVTLVRVVDSAFSILGMATPAGSPVPARLTPEAAEEIVQSQRETAQEELGLAAAQLTSAGVEVDVLIAEGDPGETLVTMAAELRSDVVLMATHGRSGVGRVLLGSVTDYVSRHLDQAAALVVPAPR